MKITELIELLNDYKERLGDLDIYINSHAERCNIPLDITDISYSQCDGTLDIKVL